MHNLPFTPAMRAVFDALTELGQGTVDDLADKSGKARYTVEKAIKSFADAGLITPADTGTDPDDTTPTRWTLVSAPDLDNPAETDTSTSPVTDTAADSGTPDEHDDTELDSGDPDNDLDGWPDDEDLDDEDQDDDLDDDSDATDQNPDDADPDDEDQDDEDPDDEDPGSDDNGESDEDDDGSGTDAVAVAPPSRPGDRRVMTIKAVLSEHSDDGATLDEIITESGIGATTVSRLLTAMEQAGAARLLDGPRPHRWVAGPTKASAVDPNPEPPRCPVCYQTVRGTVSPGSAISQLHALATPDGTLTVLTPDGDTTTVTLPNRPPARTPGTVIPAGHHGGSSGVNSDGSQPFGRGELERLTATILAANPGQAMSPADIATAIGTEHGRTVSSGAVRNNCTKLAAAGHIELVSETPLRFVHPAPGNPGGDEPGDNA